MDAPIIPARSADVGRNYDEEADVLCLSLGAPRPALGVDIGEGMVARYDSASNVLVGLTILGPRAKLLRELAVE